MDRAKNFESEALGPGLAIEGVDPPLADLATWTFVFTPDESAWQKWGGWGSGVWGVGGALGLGGGRHWGWGGGGGAGGLGVCQDVKEDRRQNK